MMQLDTPGNRRYYRLVKLSYQRGVKRYPPERTNKKMVLLMKRKLRMIFTYT